MKILTQILPWIQVIVSVLLIIAILIQRSEAGIGALGGGGGSASIHHTRRGFEKFVFHLTIVLAVLFAAASFAAILL